MDVPETQEPLIRINPADVPDEFRRLGITPVRGAQIPKASVEGTAGIYAYLTGGKFAKSPAEPDPTQTATAPKQEYLATSTGLDSLYCYGLVNGWEGMISRPDNAPKYEAGIQDGRAAWKACVDAGLVKEH